MEKVLACLLLLGICGALAEKETHSDNQAESSVASYSTVVVHHPVPKGKKGVKDQDGSRSEAYFKVKRLRASTEAPQSNHSDSEDKKKQDNKADNSDFRPSQYIPESEIRVTFHTEKDQSSQGAKNSEFYYSKESSQPEYRKHKEYKLGGEGEGQRATKWHRQPYRYKPRQQHSDEDQKEQQFHREVFIHHPVRGKAQDKERGEGRERSPAKEQFTTVGYAFQTSHGIPVQLVSPTEHRLRPIPPPGMSDELIETLLSQEPQRFDAEPKALKARTKGEQAFKVGYSMSFGGGGGDDVVFGKPKNVHVDGKHSVWKTLGSGVEMSHNLENKKKPSNVLKNDVYYVKNFQPDTSVPTSGRTSFDHAQALTKSNPFDVSNAVDPKWLKEGRALDMSTFYQSLGYPPPLPVLLPGGARGEGTMVHAIVIPIDQIGAFDYSWPQVPMMPLGGQALAQALTLAPVVTSAPLSHTQASYERQQDRPRKSPRAPKALRSEPPRQEASFSSSPIVVAPAPPHASLRQAKDVQRELNDILAEEMRRKNQRLPATGLRPPPA